MAQQVPVSQQYVMEKPQQVPYGVPQPMQPGMMMQGGGMGNQGQMAPQGMVGQPQMVPNMQGVMPGGTPMQGDPNDPVVLNPGEAQYAQPAGQQYVGAPPGMTRESMQPGYVPGIAPDHQPRVFNPAFSFRDSFGNSRSKCCTIS